MRAHFEFQHSLQGSSETVAEYVTSLRTLLADCDFHGQDSYHLAVQLACGARDKDAQKTLLAQKKVDLDEFVRLLQAEESAKLNASAIRGEGGTRQINFLKRGGGPSARGGRRPPKGERPPGKEQRNCPGCGRKGHPFKSEQRPAAAAACNSCGNIGHYESCCRKKKRQAAGSQQLPPTQVKWIRINSARSGASEADFSCDVDICTLGRKVRLQGQVDSGSDISIISAADLNAYFAGEQLLKTDDDIRNFDDSRITGFWGKFNATVMAGGKTACCDIHVLEGARQSIYGRDMVQALQLTLDGKTMKVQQAKTHNSGDYEAMLAGFPDLLQDAVGCYPDYQHHITLSPEAKPAAQRMRPIPLAKRSAVDSEIETMVEQGIWEPAPKSNWAHHMVLVKKPDDSVRITTDLSPLNKFVTPDRFPLPTIQDLFLELRGATVFSTIDIKKAFYNIELAEESRPLTATLTPRGLFQYCRLPMGLSESPSVCQRLISQALAGCKGCLVYMDDVIIFGKDRAEHDANLREVFQRLQAKNLRLQKKKCVFGVAEVKFLGLFISADGLRPDPESLRPIADTPEPHSTKEVQRFLGCVNYYAQFLPKLAETAEPLRKLTRKNTKFSWNDDCRTSFQALKTSLLEKMRLFIFDPNAETMLTTDASDVGVGAVLSQVQSGQEVPISFASHTLSETERRYAANEREALGVVWACERFEKYLLGRPFLLRTDHSSLRSLLTRSSSARQSAKFHRWFDRLSAFNFRVEHRRGEENQVADHLSRLQLASNSSEPIDDTPPKHIYQVRMGGINYATLQQATRADKLIQKICGYLKDGWPAKKLIDRDVKPYYDVKHLLSEVDDLLLRDGERIVVPASLQRQLLQSAHAGHPGIVRLKMTIRRAYWWPNQSQEVEQLVRTCSGCQASSKSAPRGEVPKTRMDRPAKPWDRVGIDITGPFVTAPEQHKYIVVLLDHHSNFPEVLLTADITTSKIATWLADQFARYGNPGVLISDNGPQFASEAFTAFLRDRSITHWRTAVYNPAENGQVEVFNRYLKHGLQAAHAVGQRFVDGVRDLLASYRATPQAGWSSPAELFMKRVLRQAFEVRRPEQQHGEKSVPTGTEDDRTMKKTASVAEGTHLRNRGPYSVGDTVLLKRPQTLLRAVALEGTLQYRGCTGPVHLSRFGWSSVERAPSEAPLRAAGTAFASRLHKPAKAERGAARRASDGAPTETTGTTYPGSGTLEYKVNTRQGAATLLTAEMTY